MDFTFALRDEGQTDETGVPPSQASDTNVFFYLFFFYKGTQKIQNDRTLCAREQTRIVPFEKIDCFHSFLVKRIKSM